MVVSKSRGARVWRELREGDAQILRKSNFGK